MTTRYAPGGVTVSIGKSQEVQIPAPILRGRCTCLHFDTDKAFLLPMSIPGIRGLRRFYDQHPGLTVLVNGHTDLVGDAAYNRQLSDERAASVAAYLMNRVDDWMQWYRSSIPSKRWSIIEDQHMLSTLHDASDTPYYSGPITGIADLATRSATTRFQTDNGLAVDGELGDQTRRALVTKYMELEGTTLPASATLVTHGCGLFHPVDQTAQADQGNRRVEIFLFDGPVDPPARTPCPAPGCPEYPQWVAQLTEDVDLCKPVKSGRLRVRVFDSFAQPLASVACKLFADGKELFAGNTDAQGFVQTGDLELPDRCQVKWTTASTMPDSDDLLIYTLDAFVNLDAQSDDDAVRMRLSNLGYRFGDTMRDDIQAFQRERGLAETGEVADVKDKLAEIHDRFTPGNPPAPAPFFMTSQHEP